MGIIERRDSISNLLIKVVYHNIDGDPISNFSMEQSLTGFIERVSVSSVKKS